MESSQGSTTTTALTSTAMDVHLVDVLEVRVKEFIAGGVAGLFSKTAVAPLERVKILLQTRSEGFQSLGVCQSLKTLKQREGILGLYKGNGAASIRIAPYAALHFMAYEQYRSLILNNCSSFGTGPVIDLLAGSAAGGTAVLCTYPLDLARTKLAYQVTGSAERSGYYIGGSNAPPAYKGIADVLRNVYKEGGLRSLYRGVGPTLIGILPYAGLKFYIYEELKTHVPEKHQTSFLLQLPCGALAGVFGQTFTYPLDVVRRRMQVQSQQLSSLGDREIRSTVHGLSSIIRTQGWRQLFAGLSLNYLKIVPQTAIGFTTYDTMRSWLQVPPRQKTRSMSAS